MIIIFRLRTRGLSVAPENEIKGGTVEENVKITLDILNGEKSARRDIVVLNAGAAIYTTGIADTIERGRQAGRRGNETAERRWRN